MMKFPRGFDYLIFKKKKIELRYEMFMSNNKHVQKEALLEYSLAFRVGVSRTSTFEVCVF